jgi:hypothetical protein
MDLFIPLSESARLPIPGEFWALHFLLFAFTSRPPRPQLIVLALAPSLSAGRPMRFRVSHRLNAFASHVCGACRSIRKENVVRVVPVESP